MIWRKRLIKQFNKTFNHFCGLASMWLHSRTAKFEPASTDLPILVLLSRNEPSGNVMSCVASLIWPSRSNRSSHARRDAVGSYTAPIWIHAVITFPVRLSLSLTLTVPLTLSLHVLFHTPPPTPPTPPTPLFLKSEAFSHLTYSEARPDILHVSVVCWHHWHPICVNVTPTQLHQQGRQFKKCTTSKIMYSYKYIHILFVLMIKH